MELIGEKVRLRPVDETDMDDLYLWWYDPEFNGEYSGDYPKSRPEVEALFRGASSYIILGRSDSRKIGFISYYTVRQDYPYLFEIGYRIKPSERRKGYTTEAAGLILGHIFATRREVERIESVTDVGNVASQRVLEKNGFKREGVLKKRFYLNGRFRDEYMYGLLREDWELRRPSSQREKRS